MKKLNESNWPHHLYEKPVLRPLAKEIDPAEWLDECLGLWPLKNSSTEDSRKIHRARMAYKRFSWTGETFSIPGFQAVCAEDEFFNTHAI
jgi:hypothetical protein